MGEANVPRQASSAQRGWESYVMAAEDYSGPEVMAFRLATLEHMVSGLDKKFDSFIEAYPNMNTLELHLIPINKELKELRLKQETADAERRAYQSQFKLTIMAAVFSTLAAAVMLFFLISVGIENGRV